MSCQINPVVSPSGSLVREHYQLVFPVSLPALGLVQYHLLPGVQGCNLATVNTINHNIEGYEDRVSMVTTSITTFHTCIAEDMCSLPELISRPKTLN